MSNIFNVSEVIEFAITIEQNGYKFYLESIKKLEDKEIIELFQYLADEELKHEEMFKGLLYDIGDFAPHESYEGEYESYSNYFLKSHALGNQELLQKYIDSIVTVDDAINIALEFEKDSIVFFSGLRKHLSNHLEKLDIIVQEEIDHIIKINEYKKKH